MPSEEEGFTLAHSWRFHLRLVHLVLDYHEAAHHSGLVRFRLLWKRQWKTSWGGKGLFHLTDCSPSWREVKAGIQGRNLEVEPKQSLWRGAACWLVSPGLSSLLSGSLPEPPAQGKSTHSELDFTSILSRKFLMLLPMPSLMGTFSQRKFSLLR